MRAAWLVAFLVAYALIALLHWAAWRWLVRVAPQWTQRHRRPKLAVFVGLFALPLARVVAFVHPRDAIWSIVAACGLLWHLTVAMTMVVIGLFRAGRALQTQWAKRRGALPPPLRAFDRGDADGVGPGGGAAAKSGTGTIDRRQALERAVGAVAFAASGATLGWGTLRGRYEWSIEEVAVRLPKLPKALDGFTIVQLSDLHVGTFIGERELDMGLGLLDKIRADLIAITGDIVDADPQYVPVAARRLGALSAREGVVCIPGNHDYYIGENAVLGGMRRAGIDVLVNRGRLIAPGDGGGFALLGVDDLSARAGRHDGTGPDLALAQSMVPPDRATVLLAHQPRFAEIAAPAGIDLQLSGHTHGGQINPGFRPIDLFFRYVEGRYRVGAMQLYVNRGFGTVGPPTRVGAPPEITKIVLVAG
jgi:predicted MPP superfamily phosphohydrolase